MAAVLSTAFEELIFEGQEGPGGFFGELRLGLGNELCTVHGDVHDVVVDLIEPLDVPTFTRTRAEIEGGRGAAVRG